MSSFNERPLFGRETKNDHPKYRDNYPVLNSMTKKGGPFDLEEFIIFLRVYFRENNIYFKEAEAIRTVMKSIRMSHDHDRLSKIEEIFFYGSQNSDGVQFNLEFNIRTHPKRDDILDQNLKDDTLNRFIEDLRYYFPLIPVTMRSVMALSFVLFFHNIIL